MPSKQKEGHYYSPCDTRVASGVTPPTCSAECGVQGQVSLESPLGRLNPAPSERRVTTKSVHAVSNLRMKIDRPSPSALLPPGFNSDKRPAESPAFGQRRLSLVHGWTGAGRAGESLPDDCAMPVPIAGSTAPGTEITTMERRKAFPRPLPSGDPATTLRHCYQVVPFGASSPSFLRETPGTATHALEVRARTARGRTQPCRLTPWSYASMQRVCEPVLR
jgi:hypothetical protein